MLHMKNVSFSYSKDKETIHDINLDLQAGSAIALLGHNGAGKTTIIKLALKLLEQSTGTIKTQGNIAYVPDNGGFYPSLTVNENTIFRAKIARIPPKESQINQLLNSLGLQKYSDQLSGNLSHGLKKRLSIACALITQPQVLVLDEPTNGLDPVSRNTICGIIKIEKQKNTAILLSSHDLEFVSSTCETGLLLKNGRTVWSGKIEANTNTLKQQYLEMSE